MSEESHSPVAERVHELLGPVVATTGLELIDVEWTGGTLRVVVDGEDGVTSDGLAGVNRLVSPILDQHDPVPGRYTLEVSSPGVERPLRRLDHYRRAIGEHVVVKLVPTAEPRRLKGRLVNADEDGLTIDTTEIDGVDLDGPKSHTVSLADVAKARTVFEWGPGPKPGGGSKSKRGHKGGKRQRPASSPGDGGGDGGNGDSTTATQDTEETSQR